VQAVLPSDGTLLTMADSRPSDVPEVADAGWPGLVRNLTVTDAEGRAVAVTEAGASGWMLEHPVSGPITLRYEIDYAPLAQRAWPAPREAGFADADHVVLIGRSLFITTPAQQASEVRFTLPGVWQLAAPWPEVPGVHQSAAVASAADLTENLIALVRDTPDVITAGGFDLKVVALGHWQPARSDVRRALTAALQQLVAMIGFDGQAEYLVVMLPHTERGGESFRASFAITSDQKPSRANMGRWGNLVAHEVFHYWNGWQLQGADYPSSQWFQEGLTEYAANRALVSAELIQPDEFYGKLGTHVDNYRRLATSLDAPGTRKGPPLYSGGALIAFTWDVMIREATHDQRGVHDVLRALLRITEDGAKPYAWSDIHSALETVAPGAWTDFHRRFIHGREQLPLADTFARIGLRMSRSIDGSTRIEVDGTAPETAETRRRALMGRSR
jgi:predicted metalloprotease with PDZ domain